MVIVNKNFLLFISRRQINEEVRSMMRELFPSLELELINFIVFGDRMDNL